MRFVSGTIRQEKDELLALLNLEEKKELEAQLKETNMFPSWTLWWIRWFVVSLFYSYDKPYKNKKVQSIFNKIISSNGIDETTAKKIIETLIREIQNNEILVKLKHIVDMCTAFNLKQVLEVHTFWDNNVLGKKFEDIPLKYESPYDLIEEFDLAEKQHHKAYKEKNSKGKKKSLGRMLIKDLNDYEIVAKFSNNIYWIFAGIGKSKDDQTALGHCGEGGKDSKIYSLRKYVERENTKYFEFFTTLEVNLNGYIIQNKGALNKPQPKYKNYVQSFILNMDKVIGTELGDLEMDTIVSNLEEFDYLLENRDNFDFVNLFRRLVSKEKIQNELNKEYLMLTKEQLKNYGKKIKSRFPEKGHENNFISLLGMTEPENLEKYLDKKSDWYWIGSLLAQYHPSYLEQYQHKIDNWDSAAASLATHNPDYLEQYQNRITRWSVIGECLAQYNPSYLEKYQNKITYWKWIQGALAQYNPSYLEKYQNKITDWKWIQEVLAAYNPDYLEQYQNRIIDWDWVAVKLAQYNPFYLEKYQDKIKNWGWVAVKLAQYNPFYLEKYQDKIKNWDWVLGSLDRYNPSYLEQFKHKLKE